jgi:deazaflavin-dependent oxidoreductase (nitroreductase family)
MAHAAARPEASPPTTLQRWVQRLASVAWITRAVAPVVHAVDRRLLAWSGDRVCLTALAIGLPVWRITTTGARTGLARTHPLTGLLEGDRLALIGSNFGRPHFPAWTFNLRAHPVARVHRDGRTEPYTARPASAEEYGRLWRRAVALYPGYARYAERAAPRRVPIFILEPLRGGGE